MGFNAKLMGFMGNQWEINGIYGKSMGNKWDLWEINGK